MINKDLLYSTGTSTQYSVITHMGKESEIEQIYVCVITESLYHIPETSTILSVNYTQIETKNFKNLNENINKFTF